MPRCRGEAIRRTAPELAALARRRESSGGIRPGSSLSCATRPEHNRSIGFCLGQYGDRRHAARSGLPDRKPTGVGGSHRPCRPMRFLGVFSRLFFEFLRMGEKPTERIARSKAILYGHLRRFACGRFQGIAASPRPCGKEGSAKQRLPYPTILWSKFVRGPTSWALTANPKPAGKTVCLRGIVLLDSLAAGKSAPRA